MAQNVAGFAEEYQVGETLKQFISNMTEHINGLKKNIPIEDVISFVDRILNSETIFILGAGRSGFVARAFAMRLMHMGFRVYVVGETVTPRIQENDLLVAISGSGETTSVVDLARKAKKHVGCQIAAITSRRSSKLARLADIKIILKSRDKKAQPKGKDKDIAPLGTMFEISALIFLDGLVAELMKIKNLSEEDLRKKHSVLE